MILLGKFLALFPRGLLDAFGAGLGTLVWLLGIRRGVVLSNLELAFPEKPEAERRAIAKATYRNLGRMVVEFLRMPGLSRAEVEGLFDYEGWEHLERAQAQGRGVIACAAHFGNFDLLASAHAQKGVPLTMIARKMGDTKANDLWRSVRHRSGIEELVVKKGETLRAARRALAEGRVLAYVIDQNERRRSAVFPTFFGVPAATAATPAVLSRRAGCPVVFAVSLPLGGGRHKVFVEPVPPRDTGDHDADVLAFMQDLNDRLERWVRAHPEHWYWVHRRWKTRPPLTPGEGAR
ncbi:MAG: lysophospholipid acyltransferase family protein [Anaeromyxobacter sp.]